MKTPSATTPSNACSLTPRYANNASELVAVMREQFELGADFIKIYETGPRFGAATASSPRRINTAKPNGRRRPGSSASRASTSPSTPPVSPAPGYAAHAQASSPSITLFSCPRNHAPDARQTDLRRSDVHHHRILRRSRRHARSRPPRPRLADVHAREFRSNLLPACP